MQDIIAKCRNYNAQYVVILIQMYAIYHIIVQFYCANIFSSNIITLQ